VGLEAKLHVLGQIGSVDLLLEGAEPVPDHHDLVEEARSAADLDPAKAQGLL
jgi:hypothetical protein